jgi:hypothetical protein
MFLQYGEKTACNQFSWCKILGEHYIGPLDALHLRSMARNKFLIAFETRSIKWITIHYIEEIYPNPHGF